MGLTITRRMFCDECAREAPFTEPGPGRHGYYQFNLHNTRYTLPDGWLVTVGGGTHTFCEPLCAVAYLGRNAVTRSAVVGEEELEHPFADLIGADDDGELD